MQPHVNQGIRFRTHFARWGVIRKKYVAPPKPQPIISKPTNEGLKAFVRVLMEKLWRQEA